MKRTIYLIGSMLLLVGCVSRQAPVLQPVTPQPKVLKEPEPVVTPVKPKKVHQLKEVQDDNFNPDYMYPQTHTVKQTPKAVETPSAPVSTPATPTMSKEECIAMIGQEKFDKYTAMLGGESGAIKRCMMLKSMQ